MSEGHSGTQIALQNLLGTEQVVAVQDFPEILQIPKAIAEVAEIAVAKTADYFERAAGFTYQDGQWVSSQIAKGGRHSIKGRTLKKSGIVSADVILHTHPPYQYQPDLVTLVTSLMPSKRSDAKRQELIMKAAMPVFSSKDIKALVSFSPARIANMVASEEGAMIVVKKDLDSMHHPQKMAKELDSKAEKKQYWSELLKRRRLAVEFGHSLERIMRTGSTEQIRKAALEGAAMQLGIFYACYFTDTPNGYEFQKLT